MMRSDEVSVRLRHFVTWRVVAELMRRHKLHEHLYVMELHPGGGQGDTLALYAGRPHDGHARKLDDFRGWRRLGEAPRPQGLEEHGGYVWPWLLADDPRAVVDAVEAAVGLPVASSPLPRATPTVRCFCLMADVLGLALNSRQSLQWRSAWHDSSGMEGCYVRGSFLELRHRLGTSLTEKSEWPDDGAELVRWWMLMAGGGGGPVHAVVDLRGRVWAGPGLHFEAGVPGLVSRRGSCLGAALDVWSATGLR